MIPFIDLAAMHAGLHDQLAAVWHEAVGSGRFIGGPVVDRFESCWADYCGTRHCVGVSNGTAALHLTLAALDIGPGDEVLVPANTFIASAAAVVATGARPVFVDVDPETLLITAETMRPGISSRTAAVLVVHLYGQPADMDAINLLAAGAGIAVIEDAAQAHGATWNGRKAGSLSKAGCFSFYPGKNLGAFGDAGAVVTNDKALADRIRALSNHGRCHDDPYRHEVVGGTERLDALQAGVLTVKLGCLDAWNAARRRVAQVYADALAGLPITIPAIAPSAVSAHHLMVVQTAERNLLRRALAAEQIGSSIHYPLPCHRQPAFASRRSPALPVAEAAADRVLSLPMYPHLTEAQIGRVADVMRRALDTAEQSVAA